MAHYLTDGNIELRAAEPYDLDFIYELENDSSMWDEGDSSTPPLSRRVIADFLTASTGDIYTDRQMRLIIVETESQMPAGCIDLYDFDPANHRAGVGIAVVGSRRRKGIALAALSLLCEYCRLRLGMHQLWAVTAASNMASRALFAAAGFRTCGSLRSWLRRGSSYADALIYQRLLVSE